ncbi:MAG: hypothetical protein ACJAZ8_002851 [Planctomycetota bacterium]|jgi:hypothetical protein
MTIRDLCCHEASAIFSFCVDNEELLELGLSTNAGHTSHLGRLRALGFLRSLCRDQWAVSTRLTDLLDLKYLDTILIVREMDQDQIDRITNTWSRSPRGDALPGLIWALCSDERGAIRLAGLRLASEATWLGCQRLVKSPGPSS